MKQILSNSIIILIIFMLVSCVRYEKIPEKFQFLDDETFKMKITYSSGFAVVLFYNVSYWQSQYMERQFHFFADKYYGKTKFYKFPWKIDKDPSNYKLEMLPTLVLYEDGIEQDRIKGIPAEKKFWRNFEQDIDLWFIKNVLKLQGSEYDGHFNYFFHNSHVLQIENE